MNVSTNSERKIESSFQIDESLSPKLPSSHPNIARGKIGILLVNLGTPDATDYFSMRRYLSEFLTDRRVIEWPKLIWYPILFGIVLLRRPQKSGHAYQTIWNTELDESPLRTMTRNQAKKLAENLKKNQEIIVEWAMRYGNPAISERLNKLKDQGCERILIFPLYPQYSASTTATVNDKVFETLQKLRWQPAIRIVPPYHDDEIYIKNLTQSIQEHLLTLDFEPEKLLVSFHGIPQSYFKKGDPYHCHCQKTTRLLRENLGWEKERVQITFQSRFGPEEWLQPYTDKTIEALAIEGVKNIAVVNPGFVSDCLETLEEIAIQGAEIFKANGGENFTHIPCLNDGELGMEVIKSVVMRELQGWI